MSTGVLKLSPLNMNTAPEASKPLLARVQREFGFIPNLLGTAANSPAFLAGYFGADDAYTQASLSPVERQIVLQAASVENACRYCVAAHSTVLKAMMKVPAEVVEAVRVGTPLPDAQLDALVNLTKEMVGKGGHVSAGTVGRFIAAGYGKAQVFEVLLGVALKTMSNYTHHLTEIDIDAAFLGEAL